MDAPHPTAPWPDRAPSTDPLSADSIPWPEEDPVLRALLGRILRRDRLLRSRMQALDRRLHRTSESDLHPGDPDRGQAWPP